MCKQSNNFKFCTCSNTDNLSETSYVWELTRFIRNYDSLSMGTIIMPVGDLGQGVTMSSVLAFLNSNINPFDFEYNPLENDSLDIRTGNDCSKYVVSLQFSEIHPKHYWELFEKYKITEAQFDIEKAKDKDFQYDLKAFLKFREM